MSENKEVFYFNGLFNYSVSSQFNQKKSTTELKVQNIINCYEVIINEIMLTYNGFINI